MKKLITIITLSLTLLIPASSYAWGGYACGLEPLKPMGCLNGQAMCVCDDFNNCNWVFVGC